jgi:hypothetical protein
MAFQALPLRNHDQQAFNEFFAQHGSLSSVLGVPGFSVEKLGGQDAASSFSFPYVDQRLHLREDADWEDDEFEIDRDNPFEHDFGPHPDEAEAEDMNRVIDETIERRIREEIEQEYLEEQQQGLGEGEEQLSEAELAYQLERSNRRQQDRAVPDDEDEWEDD